MTFEKMQPFTAEQTHRFRLQLTRETKKTLILSKLRSLRLEPAATAVGLKACFTPHTTFDCRQPAWLSACEKKHIKNFITILSGLQKSTAHLVVIAQYCWMQLAVLIVPLRLMRAHVPQELITLELEL